MKFPHINWAMSLWLMCFVPFIACILLSSSHLLRFPLNVGSLCACNPVYYLQLHIHSQSSELDLLTEVNGPDFICKTKPSWESLHICYNFTPSCTRCLRRLSWIVKGSYSKNQSVLFSSSYSTKLGRGQVSCILQ